MKDNFFQAKLLDTYLLTKQVRHFVLEISADFSYIPGQFITIHFEYEGKEFKRSYSIASAPSKENIVEFAAGEVKGGPGTEFLFNLQKGDFMQISGPYGRLIVKEPLVKRYILVGTSTGITPYRAMIPMFSALLANNPHLELVILEGVQKHEDVLYLEDFKTFAAGFSKVDFRVHFSRDKAQASYEYEGYVQTAFRGLNINPENDMVYLCGNPAMIDDSFKELQELGLVSQKIVREKYISR